jgi:hypothetical protein
MKYYTFLTGLMYNAAMKKGKRKEEEVAKISITTEVLKETFDDCIEVLEEVDWEEMDKLEKLWTKKFLAEKKRKKSN